MNEIRIPKRFKLMGQTISVEQVSHIGNTNNTLGEARHFQNSILLQKSVEGMELPTDRAAQIYLHEVMHLVLHNAGVAEMAADETFVDLISSLLHQVLTTSEYEDSKPVRKTLRKPKK